mmetsp:Transcript_113620/g.332006  ORF Transcript_113620/g.332006 Transcript_113620/m.332006 type:complete len:203 (+) Transcript_113620:1072-1680(+)
MEASTCVRDREANSLREGISTSTSLAGLLFFSRVQTAMTLSLGDHWKVCSASYFSLTFFPSSSLMRSKVSVSRTRIAESLHSAKNFPSWLHRKCGNSPPRGATEGVRHFFLHSPVSTRKMRTAFSSPSAECAPFHVRMWSSVGENWMYFTDSCANLTFFLKSGPPHRAIPCWWKVARYEPWGDHCTRQSHQIFLFVFSRSPP